MRSQKTSPKTGALTTEVLKKAIFLIMRLAHAESFAEELGWQGSKVVQQSFEIETGTDRGDSRPSSEGA